MHPAGNNDVAGILRTLAEFGDAAGWLAAAVVIFYYARFIMKTDDRAHADLERAIKANGSAIADLRGDMERIRDNVQAIATDMAVLRDRANRPTTGGETGTVVS